MDQLPLNEQKCGNTLNFKHNLLLKNKKSTLNIRNEERNITVINLSNQKIICHHFGFHKKRKRIFFYGSHFKRCQTGLVPVKCTSWIGWGHRGTTSFTDARAVWIRTCSLFSKSYPVQFSCKHTHTHYFNSLYSEVNQDSEKQLYAKKQNNVYISLYQLNNAYMAFFLGYN